MSFSFIMFWWILLTICYTEVHARISLENTFRVPSTSGLHEIIKTLHLQIPPEITRMISQTFVLRGYIFMQFPRISLRNPLKIPLISFFRKFKRGFSLGLLHELFRNI